MAGEIGQGKTTRLISLYNEINHGDGFVNEKLFLDGMNAGQKIIRLSTGEGVNFSFKETFIPEEWDEECRFSTYSFSKRGFRFALNIITDILERGIEPIFVDEIGPLEIQNKGFYSIFLMLLKEKKDLYVAIRKNCVKDAIQKFQIKDYKIIML